MSTGSVSFGTRYDGVGTSYNTGIATTKSKPKKRKHKCRGKRRRRNTAPAPAPAPVAVGLGGFRLGGTAVQASNWSGGAAQGFALGNQEVKTVLTDADNGGYAVRVKGQQSATNPSATNINSFGVDANGSRVEVCKCGDINDAGTLPVTTLPSGVKISTEMLSNGKEAVKIEGTDYQTTGTINQEGGDCYFDLDTREKAVDVANNAVGDAPLPQFLNIDQIF
jgi:hypothetical protein